MAPPPSMSLDESNDGYCVFCAELNAISMCYVATEHAYWIRSLGRLWSCST